MPLASGLLTGKYKSRSSDPGRLGRTLRGVRVSDYMPGLLTQDCLDVVADLEDYANQRGHTLIELALGWLVSKPYVATVIAGATTPEQLCSNVAATYAWALTEEETSEVEAITSTTIAYTWNAGFPSYATPPAGVDTECSPDVRVEH
jgi:aryl-alcohol dehydrogenase-like predicted oxidoreductase